MRYYTPIACLLIGTIIGYLIYDLSDKHKAINAELRIFRTMQVTLDMKIAQMIAENEARLQSSKIEKK